MAERPTQRALPVGGANPLCTPLYGAGTGLWLKPLAGALGGGPGPGVAGPGVARPRGSRCRQARGRSLGKSPWPQRISSVLGDGGFAVTPPGAATAGTPARASGRGAAAGPPACSSCPASPQRPRRRASVCGSAPRARPCGHMPPPPASVFAGALLPPGAGSVARPEPSPRSSLEPASPLAPLPDPQRPLPGTWRRRPGV